MELSSLLDDLRLFSSSSAEKPRPSVSLPPITELLSHLQQQLIGAADESCLSLIGRVERLFQSGDPDWLFSPCSANQGAEQAGWAGLQAAYLSVVRAVIGCAALPLCEEDCPPPAAAYHSVPRLAAAASSALTALLRTLGNLQGGGGAGVRGQRGLLLTLAPQVCVFSVTHIQVQVWTSSSSRKAAKTLQVELLRAGCWRDSTHLLMGDRRPGEEEEEEQEQEQEGQQEEEEQEEHGGRCQGILGGILDVLQPQLTKDSWQLCEAVKLVFAWTLLQVTRPSLSPHLPRLLPPSLLLNDHHRPENCMLGIRCLHHIVLNTPSSDLRQWNSADVVYQALFRHLYTSDDDVIQLVLSCLLDLLLVLEKPPSSLAPSSSRRKPCRHDDVLRLVLTHMEAEHKVALRRVYASALPQYLDRMGVALCRHLRRLERVVLGYLELRDPPEETSTMKILQVLQKILKAAWPRMETRVDTLLRCLLRLLVDVSSDCELRVSVKEEVMSQTVHCIQLLDSCSHGKIQSLLQQVDSSCCSSEVLGCLATVTMRTER
ncbi:TELO2-interacting protein 2 [Scomber scombrus]|uniref:TELO2-interacting protein 2 n=1 Tax=Scomber scombrus TaxID=13677 RepID=UPI002DD9CD3F|nr:TELO2-interacting protein 2 [Scomber scombrus]XP_062272881.1 TELO2-interacting protein 2 [Scomber scombrus]